MTDKIVIVAGDPNSINSEIIFKTWKNLDKRTKNKIYIIGNFKLISQQFKKLKYKINLYKTNNLIDSSELNSLKVLDIPLKFNNPFNVPQAEAYRYLRKSLIIAHKLSKDKKIIGFINCPINKKLISKKGNIGITEYLASMCKIKDGSEVMFIHNKKLSVVPITTHLDIKNIAKKITTNLIVKKVNTLNKFYKKIFKKRPKIGILGLNPHNAELRKNSEEVLIINPAIKRLKLSGINISELLVADTVFIKNYKKFDVLVGMYHDQVLGPFKTLFNFDAINVTLGLDYTRLSPDHGPAYDLIGKNKSNYFSLFKCVKFLNKLR